MSMQHDGILPALRDSLADYNPVCVFFESLEPPHSRILERLVQGQAVTGRHF
jgi:hypothetical protein